MDKRKVLAVAGGVVGLLVVVGVVFSVNQGSQPAAPPQPAIETVEQPATNKPETMPVPGVYVAYTAEAIAAAKDTKILFFYAPWCPQCRALDASIKAASLPDGLTIFKVDYDSNQTLRQKYGVTLQTTLVKIDDDGGKIKSYVAYDEPSYATLARELLP